MRIKIKNKWGFYGFMLPVFILCLSTSCAVNKTSTEQSVVFSLKTTSCMGQCPVYEFKVFDNRSFTFLGESNVNLIGEKQGELSKGQYQQIIEAVSEADFFNITTEKNMQIKDLPTKYLYAKNSDEERTIDYYYPKNEKLDQLLTKVRGVLVELELIKQ